MAAFTAEIAPPHHKKAARYQALAVAERRQANDMIEIMQEQAKVIQSLQKMQVLHLSLGQLNERLDAMHSKVNIECYGVDEADDEQQ